MSKLLQEEMKRVKSLVDEIILDQLLPNSDPIPEVDLLYRMMRDYPQRPAKGLRPFILVTSCKAFGGKEEDSLVVAASLELFQNWILIHDDIEDGSAMRRGSPALHKKYDWTLALNAGDALHAKMWGTLLSCKDKLTTDKTLRIMQEFSSMIDETTEGQHIELGWVVAKRWDLTEVDYYNMCTKKTAWYTSIAPLRLGGMVANAPDEDLRSLVDIGTKLGVGFQIQDDVLNLSGDQVSYGKEIAGDLLEGKRTLILIRLLTLSSEDERRRVAEIMSMGRDERVRHVKEVLTLIEKHDAIGYASSMAKTLVDEARSEMKGLHWRGDPSSVSLLDEVARFSVERQW